ncbi:hypothetical protein [Micromonospora sp. NPDC050695]|uniref:hypothetical protein n=1 Tax=Micromonospora sp. NPDC050695 TaxID=3154938 RepID=UPI0033F2E4EB
MPQPTQQSRRRTRRLLLLTGLGIGAGIGLALTASSPAHADNQPHTDTLGGVTQHTSSILGDQPVRDLTGRLRDATATAVTHTTDTVDDATRPIPVAGHAVDNITNTTDMLVDAIRPATKPADTPTIADTPTTGHAGQQPPAGTQTASEPAPPGPPTPDGASSGAPSHTAPQHPDVRRPTGDHHGDSRTVHHRHQTSGIPAIPPTRTYLNPGSDNANQHLVGSLRTPDHSGATNRPTGPPRWQQPHTRHHNGRYDGRTQPPSPPPG